jgi:hypothetical protein
VPFEGKGGLAMATATLTVPAGVRKVYRRFERWRSAHRGRLPIPDDLWASAAEVAKEHGVFRTAKILRLEYGKLKPLVQSAAPVPRTTAPPAFVELMAPQVVGLSECMIELEGPVARCASNGKEPRRLT